MDTVKVKTIVLDKPLTATGKIFTGDYAKSPEYITEVQKELGKGFIPFIPNKVMGVYYDNPQVTKTEDLKSFQGVFVRNETTEISRSLTRVSLKGRYLYISVTGDPMKAIYEGYAALFAYIQQTNVALKSPAGYQVSTFENGAVTTEIYMELA